VFGLRSLRVRRLSSLLETGGPSNTGDVALYTKTRQMSPPLNVAKALAET
jgi:hypothetical protein